MIINDISEMPCFTSHNIPSCWCLHSTASTYSRPFGFTCNNSRVWGCHRFESEDVHFHSTSTFTSMSGTFRREEQAPHSYIKPWIPPLPLSFLLRRQGADSKMPVHWSCPLASNCLVLLLHIHERYVARPLAFSLSIFSNITITSRPKITSSSVHSQHVFLHQGHGIRPGMC